MILDPALWQRSIFIAGKWSQGSGGVRDVVEPATGKTFGEIGMADPSDVAHAAEHAAEAQRGWAALPHPQPAAVLRKAGQLFSEHVPTGIVHINHQTVNDEANAPFGGVGASGTGSRFGGGAANIEAFTETRWVTTRGEPPTYSL
jgi:acyl-CoA reductase-like NAD-dependent aldehyde dehydrogenase